MVFDAMEKTSVWFAMVGRGKRGLADAQRAPGAAGSRVPDGGRNLAACVCCLRLCAWPGPLRWVLLAVLMPVCWGFYHYVLFGARAGVSRRPSRMAGRSIQWWLAAEQSRVSAMMVISQKGMGMAKLLGTFLSRYTDR